MFSAGTSALRDIFSVNTAVAAASATWNAAAAVMSELPWAKPSSGRAGLSVERAALHAQYEAFRERWLQNAKAPQEALGDGNAGG